ncbi:phage tail protein [Sphingomonas qomolangmaensis]|uniref:Phage tail protein n=1 Tax=Sphingomonas qomolangmaensis TaxID=2918765 RepID=A0ABY5L5A2_9SPHN|nr:phage tail protein [Sphingomonas qomolangmaensis]UUL82120.1 phage tail protein [Sphingomonas qomolangmaensis]
MATLVLTTVGGLLGGPVGGAIGALVGRSIDGVLLRPGRREGPRLSELAVQTSSYGAQVPRLFGTIRVAGSVIWSTELIETRTSEGGGKGRPGSVQYSYAASFAVLLSARALLGVKRIWADGKLLRGAAGDFKAATGFRLHLGDSDQPVDPLIAGAVGAAQCPAWRGHAYAVFEQLQLADFGNRIPSLTFEVEADVGPVTVGAVAGALGEVGSEALVPVLDGFSAHGGSTRAVLETLAGATGAWFAPVGDGIAMRGGVGAARDVADDGVGGARAARSIAAADQAPRVLTIGHYDAARDYQAGLQRASRPGAGTRELHLELPAVLDAATAKQVAAAMLARADSERGRRRVALGWDALDIAPGDRVRVAGEDGLWRVAEWALEGNGVMLELAPIVVASARASASSGAVVAAPDRVHGATVLVAAELPPGDGALLAQPRVTIVAGGIGAGWRSATLMLANPAGEWTVAGTTRAPGVIGTIVDAPRPARATIEDRAQSILVELAHGEMLLRHADRGALDRGANLALVGDELIQFGAAVQESARRWRLSRLWRGRLGTEGAIAGHAPGERFALLAPESVVTIDLPLSAIGGTIRVGAVGIADAAPVELVVPVTGASVVPPAPVHLRARANGGGVALRWTRRSRAGWRWIDGVDAPLAEEAERYVVRVAGAELATSAPEAVVVAPAEGWRARIAQVGTIGASSPSEISQGDMR